ncbi:hypothetical protein A0H81_09699 [Grifola frondosa]|uniref:RING-type domain-containing protein n=1 Tax=Grifola frondosa TaxID=5627 RepID=A0A1C7M1F8_GRIFR|nr:hypothetical protein A0H81_09699 [Grifola frondosa]
MGPLTRSKASDNVSDSQDGPSHGIALHLTKALKEGWPNRCKLANGGQEAKISDTQAGKGKEKDRKKIDKLRMREIKAEAGELEEDAEFEEVDSAYQMRKLLRRFHDLIVATSLDEGEECPICMEKLEPDKCNSLPCEHTFCADCTRQLSPDSEKIKCPQCRTECSREDIEVVEYTASQQWDALLDVAKNWAKVDHRREEDTSDEEAEEEFIDDGHESSTTAPDTVPENPLESSPEPQVAPEELELQNVPEPSPRKRRIASRRSLLQNPSLSSTLTPLTPPLKNH